MPWTTAQQCGNHSDDAQFLDIGAISAKISSSTPELYDPREAYSCQICPEGASCNGSVTLREVVAQKGWWQCPTMSRSTIKYNSTIEYPKFGDACIKRHALVKMVTKHIVDRSETILRALVLMQPRA